MALVVCLRGVNVGGHRTFGPTSLANQLRDLGVVYVGAAGTFIVRQRITQRALRAELTRRLPFDAEVAICEGSEILRVMAAHPFAGRPARPELVCFVSILSRRPRVTLPVPTRLPSSGKWLLKILAIEKRFVFGLYRKHMKTIGLSRQAGSTARRTRHDAQPEYDRNCRKAVGNSTTRATDPAGVERQPSLSW